MENKDYIPIQILYLFVERLENLKLPYMLTGSMAMIRYTVFRMTADIDIILELSSKDRERFVEAFEKDFYIPHQSLARAIESNRMFNIIHFETAFKIDCVMKKKTEFQLTAFERRERTDYYGRAVWVITKEDLILSKLLWARESGSEMQFRDIKNLMKVGFDHDYTERWLDKLDVRQNFEKCLSEIKK